MLPFLPPNVQHIVHVIVGCLVAIFIVLKSDPTLGSLPWVVAGCSILSVLSALFTTAPGDSGLKDLKDRVAKAMAKMGPSVVFALSMGLAVSQTGCGGLKPPVIPPDTPADVAGAIGCVFTAVTSGQSVDPCIQQYGPALVADALQTLIDSLGFAKKYPDALMVVRSELARLKAIGVTPHSELWLPRVRRQLQLALAGEP